MEPLSLTAFPLRLGGAARGPASVAVCPNDNLLATASSASNNVSVFAILDRSTTFNQGFQAGFSAGDNPIFNAVFNGAYQPHGAWGLGFAAGYEAAHGHGGMTGAHAVSEATRIAGTSSAATDWQTPAIAQDRVWVLILGAALVLYLLVTSAVADHEAKQGYGFIPVLCAKWLLPQVKPFVPPTKRQQGGELCFAESAYSA